MSQRMNVLSSISNMIDFIKERSRANLVEANRGDKLNIDEESLRRVLSIVDQSISQAHSQAYQSVEKSLRELSFQQE